MKIPLVSIMAALVLMNCNTLKISKKAPFAIDKAIVIIHNDSAIAKGKLLKVQLKEPLATNIELDSVYFNNKIHKITAIGPKRKEFEAFFPDHVFENDLILERDPKKEFGNKPPQNKVKIPFELPENQCVISYRYKGKTHYYQFELGKK